MINKLDNDIDNCELKFSKSGKGEFEGYASKFNGVDSVRDTIAPGAFTETIKAARAPAMFVNHDSYSIPVGDWISLAEDDSGLYVKGKIDMNHKDGMTVYSALLRKAVDALSIGFRIPKGGADEKEDGSRIINTIDLKEISLVNFPADDAARISVVKSEIETINDLKDAELFLRDSGVFSKSAAIAYVSRIKAILHRDDEAVLKHEITKLEQQIQTNDATRSLVEFINKL